MHATLASEVSHKHEKEQMKTKPSNLIISLIRYPEQEAQLLL